VAARRPQAAQMLRTGTECLSFSVRTALEERRPTPRCRWPGRAAEVGRVRIVPCATRLDTGTPFPLTDVAGSIGQDGRAMANGMAWHGKGGGQQQQQQEMRCRQDEHRGRAARAQGRAGQTCSI